MTLRIAVCNTQPLGVDGGGEVHGSALVEALREAGHDAELFRMPTTAQSPAAIAAEALAWRLVDLTEVNGVPIDMVIALRFPAYLVRHPRKVIWLIHQMRGIYELYGGPFGYADTPVWSEARARVAELDRRAFEEAAAVLTVSRLVSRRLRDTHSLEVPHLYHPPPFLTAPAQAPEGDFLLAPGRLEPIKRQDLLLLALAECQTSPRCVITGTGSAESLYRSLARELGISDRVTFAGHVPRDDLAMLYASSRAVFVGGYEEDFGYVALEAMRMGRPVITLDDAGETLEFVDHETTALVCRPSPSSLAAAIDALWSDPELERRMRSTGPAAVDALDLSWPSVVDTLLESVS